jgi:hypothetical protein
VELQLDEKVRDRASTLNTSLGSDSDEGTWAMQLHNGQRLFVPPMPSIPLSPNPFFALSSTDLRLEKMGEAAISEA